MNMFDLGSFGAEIELDSQQFNKGMKEAEGQTKSFGSRLGGFAKTAGKVATGAVIGLAGATTGAFLATKKVTEGFDDIAKNSTKLGISTDAFQEMSYWAGQNGVSAGAMERAVGRLNQRIGMASDGNEKYSNALSALGVNMDDVREGTVTTEEAMYQSISALSQMTNEQEKSAMASELFGTRLGRDLMPALQDGSLSLEEAAQKAEELGIVVSGDTLASAEDFNDSWDDLTRSLSVFGQKIIAELIPVFQTMMDWVLDHMPQIQAIFDVVFDAIGVAISATSEFISTLISWFSELFTSSEESLGGLTEIITEVFGGIMEYLTEAWDYIANLWEEYGSQIVEYVQHYFGLVLEHFTFVFETIWGVAQELLGLIVPFIKDRVADITAFWEEHGDQIMQAIENVFGFIQKVIEFVMPAIQYVIENTWNVISRIFQGAVDILMDIIGIFASLFTGDWQGLWDSVVSLATNIWETIKDTIGRYLGVIIDVFTGTWDKITGVTKKVFESIKGFIVKPIDEAKERVGKIIDNIKGFFSNMKLSFPKLKMPKLPRFSLKGKFSLKPPSVPRLGIDWFKDGGIMTRPTVFGRNGNNLMAGGEAGAEAILPLNSSVLGGIGRGIAGTMHSGRNSDQSDELLKEQNHLLRRLLNKDTDVYMDGRKVTDHIDDIQSTDYDMASYMAGTK